MESQYDNVGMSSFLLWLDHTLLSKGKAFTNTSSFFYDVNSLYNGYNTYGSPFRQFVADESIKNIHGANIINSVNLNNSITVRGGSNFANINYDQGQVYFTSPVSNPDTTLSGDFAVKDFNTYITNDLEEKLLFETQFTVRNKTDLTAAGLPPSTMTYPAIFIKNNGSRNEPLAFGGTDQTETDIRAIVLSDDQYKIDAVGSIFRDRARTIVPVIPETGMPFNTLGDFRDNVQYNYTGLSSQFPDSGVFIDNVYTSKIGGVTYTQKTNINPDVFSMIIDFEVSDIRLPR